MLDIESTVATFQDRTALLQRLLKLYSGYYFDNLGPKTQEHAFKLYKA